MQVNLKKIDIRFIVLIALILFAASMRIFNVANITNKEFAQFSPLAAMCLFGGSSFSKHWKAILFIIATLFVSDICIQQMVYHGKYGFIYNGWYLVYAVFILITLMGKWLIKKVTLQNVLIASVIAVGTHWLIMDFTVWLSGGIDIRTNLPLSRDFKGLTQCYIQGWPFAKNLLAGTLVYSGLFFGVYTWVSTKVKVKHLAYAK